MTDRVAWVPTATWPNETLEGAAVNGSLWTPTPPTTRSRLGFDAVLVNVTFPPIHPAVFGEKTTFRATLCPAARLMGRLKPGRLNCEPLSLIAETFTLVDPVLISRTTCVSDPLKSTEPNLRFAGEQTNCGVAARAPNGSMSTTAIKVVKKKGRREECEVFDWGSRMTGSLRAFPV